MNTAIRKTALALALLLPLSASAEGFRASVSAFNLNPKSPSLATLQPGTGTSGMPYVARNAGGTLTIEFIRRRAAAAPGITYAAEFTSDLTAPWTVATAETVNPIDSTFERVTVTDPAPAPNRHTRIKVTTAP